MIHKLIVRQNIAIVKFVVGFFKQTTPNFTLFCTGNYFLIFFRCFVYLGAVFYLKVDISTCVF